MRHRSSCRKLLPFALLLSALYWLNYIFVSNDVHSSLKEDLPHTACGPSNISTNDYESVACSVDDLVTLTCLKRNNDVYFPFSFLKKHYDLTGKEKDEKFEWHTSYSKMRLPSKSYNSTGVFGHFATYSVETRERVKCINMITGVPMSTQWNATPYYYPIQIAQYGLQHYSRLVTQVDKIRSIDSGVNSNEWKGAPGSLDETSERIFYNDEYGQGLVNISCNDDITNPGVYVELSSDIDLTVLSFSLISHSPNSSFSILLSIKETNQLIILHYIPLNDSRCVWSKDIKKLVDNQLTFFYSYPYSSGEWINITRDLLVDTSRALSSIDNKKSKSKKENNVILRTGDIIIHSISFRGSFTIKQKITQSSSAHEQFFFNAANWFLSNQDSSGGWSVGVERKVADGRLILPSGWYSAMGQGHALSILSRAYFLSKDQRYIEAAIKALPLFNKLASEGGVRNVFLGVYPWYEEYPTTPGTFVLNGFMYSLVGLYDLSSISQLNIDSIHSLSPSLSLSSSLFKDGLSSLHSLLPLYDTGSGSIYDLRHVALNTPPNLARWDYHAVHVYLLKWIVSITGDNDLDQVADRWIGYANGKRAKHN